MCLRSYAVRHSIKTKIQNNINTKYSQQTPCIIVTNNIMLNNFRSQPIITRAVVVKNKDQFIFESEKPNSHNELLKEINKGVKLKKTKTNDRSKPNLEGLRKFRRQMTIEEQVQKSMSQANLAASPSGVSVAEVII